MGLWLVDEPLSMHLTVIGEMFKPLSQFVLAGTIYQMANEIRARKQDGERSRCEGKNSFLCIMALRYIFIRIFGFCCRESSFW